MPDIGTPRMITSAGWRCTAGIQMQTPNTRRTYLAASGSALTPLVARKTGSSSPALPTTVPSSSWTGASATSGSTSSTCWVLVDSRITSSVPRVTSAIEPTAVTGRVTSSRGVRSRSPSRCMAARCSPRAISTVGRPACTSRAPMPPPIAPAPTITYLLIARPYAARWTLSARIDG